MAQLNLLPDVKLQYIKTKRQKRLIIGLSIIVSGIFLVILLALLFYVRFSQKHYMSALTKDINDATQQLKQKPDLDKILTIQNQLKSLPALHDQKVISSRLFDYLTQATPTRATIANVTVDFEQNTLDIKGTADSLGTVNKFADTLKFTEFNAPGQSPDNGKAFSNVVLQSFSINGEGSTRTSAVNYELQFSFEPVIFANIKDLPEGSKEDEAVQLKIPNIISTRSETEKPEDTLFAPQPGQEGVN